MGRRDFLPAVEDEGRGPAAAGDDPLDAALHPALAPGGAVFFQQDPHHDPHALERPGEALEVERPEHDGKLADVHVVLAGAAVEHEGAEEQVLEQRVGDRPPQERPGRAGLGEPRERQLADKAGHLAEALELGGELGGDLGLQDREVVREAQAPLPGRPEGHPGALLGAEGELLPVDPQLAQDLAERRPLDPGGDVVGHRVEADVKLAAALAVEAVQAADGVVALEDADPLAEVGQPDPGGQAGQAGSDDGDVVLRP